MTGKPWGTQARLESRSRVSVVLKVLFWIWGVPGLFINGLLVLSMPDGAGAGLSSYAAACLLLWIGGLLLFGLGAHLAAGAYDFKVPETPPPE